MYCALCWSDIYFKHPTLLGATGNPWECGLNKRCDLYSFCVDFFKIHFPRPDPSQRYALNASKSHHLSIGGPPELYLPLSEEAEGKSMQKWIIMNPAFTPWSNVLVVRGVGALLKTPSHDSITNKSKWHDGQRRLDKIKNMSCVVWPRALAVTARWLGSTTWRQPMVEHRAATVRLYQMRPQFPLLLAILRRMSVHAHVYPPCARVCVFDCSQKGCGGSNAKNTVHTWKNDIYRLERMQKVATRWVKGHTWREIPRPKTTVPRKRRLRYDLVLTH